MPATTTPLTLEAALGRMSEPDVVEFRERLRVWRTWSPEQLLAERQNFADEHAHGRFVRSYLTGLASARSADYPGARTQLLRLLRHTPTAHPLQIWVRSSLVNVLIRLGDIDRAEKVARKEMGQLAFAALDPPTQAHLVSELGRAYRRKGWLSLAADVYRQAARLLPVGSWEWVTALTNLVHAELRADRLEAVHALIAELTAAITGPEGERSHWSAACCQISLAVELESAREAAFHLERARRLKRWHEPVREQLLLQNYEADVLRIQHRYSQAASHYRAALESPDAQRFRLDLVPSLRCGHAECLLRVGEHEQALSEATEASRLGAESDRLDELIAIRLQGHSQWLLGRREEARALFVRAGALHVGREFVREQARLDATIQGLDALAGRSAWISPRLQPPPREGRGGSARHRIALQDGREYVTLDPGFERMVRHTAASDLPVLIDGETGTGKELVARLIHELGGRGSRPFVVVDCSTLPGPRLEQELFGARHGAFSESSDAPEGIVAQADGGTLLLDALPELSLHSQSKLLRLLQEGSYRRLGDPTVRRVNLRFIAATNRPLEEMLHRGQIKPDLFHRLNGHRIHLRPLRDRRDEIPALASRFAERAGVSGIDDDAMELLVRAPWSGNVRELEMVIRAAAHGVRRGEAMGARDLSDVLPQSGLHGTTSSLRSWRLAAERAALQASLDAHSGNVSAAARAMGMSRQAFYKALERSGGRERS